MASKSFDGNTPQKLSNYMKHLLLILLLTTTLAHAQTQSPTPLVPTPTPSPTPDISVMVARIKAAKVVNKPFVIFLKDGSQVTVANANYIALNPSGKFTTVFVFTGDDTTNSIPVYLITKLVLVTNYPFD
jgi:hypothetical protein